MDAFNRRTFPDSETDLCDGEDAEYDSKDESFAGLPSELVILYKDIMSNPHPLLVSNEQAKFSCDPKHWELRRLLVERLNRDLVEELDFLDQLLEYDMRDNRKWHHRRWVVEKLGRNVGSRELEFTEKIISKDAYDYHPWLHRQWVFQAFDGDWEDELAYCDKILGKDISNNFAWDQRYFVVTRSKMAVDWREARRSLEVDYALKAIALEPGNDCPWTYLRNLYRFDSESFVGDMRLHEACVTVLMEEVNYLNALDEHGFILPAADVDPALSKRACKNALDMVLALSKTTSDMVSKSDFKTRSHELTSVIRVVCDVQKFAENRDVIRVIRAFRDLGPYPRAFGVLDLNPALVTMRT